MTTLRISITAEVLQATKMCGIGTTKFISKSCALSHAVREIWSEACVGSEKISPFGTIIEFPHNQAEFLKRFDRATPAERAAMQPFSFEIEVPDEVIGEVNIDEIRDIIKNSKTLELVNVINGGLKTVEVGASLTTGTTYEADNK